MQSPLLPQDQLTNRRPCPAHPFCRRASARRAHVQIALCEKDVVLFSLRHRDGDILDYKQDWIRSDIGINASQEARRLMLVLGSSSSIIDAASFGRRALGRAVKLARDKRGNFVEERDTTRCV